MGLLKFLAFEQVLKNSLTTLSMGGAKGGSDFDPKGKSDNEVMRFCQSFMNELYRHIGQNIDVPAGDIGVGGREIGFLFGQYKKITNRFCGVLTGKGLAYGGSLIRPEATGYGEVYFAQEMLDTRGDSVRGKVGRGFRLRQRGPILRPEADPVGRQGASPCRTPAARSATKNGIDAEKLEWVMDLKNNRRGRIAEYAEQFKGRSSCPDKKPWAVPCEVAFPSATQNEINKEDAKMLVDNGCFCVSEGANMPTEPGGRRDVPHAQDPLRPRQGRQRRRRGHFRPGNGAEQPAL